MILPSPIGTGFCVLCILCIGKLVHNIVHCVPERKPYPYQYHNIIVIYINIEYIRLVLMCDVQGKLHLIFFSLRVD